MAKKYKQYFKLCIHCVLTVLCNVFSVFNISAQCSFASDVCDSAPIRCNIDELSGVSCRLPSPVGFSGTRCSRYCGDNGENTIWYNFAGSGNTITISFSRSNCNLGNGIEVGVMENTCTCAVAECLSITGNSGTISFATQKCKQYSLFIDGIRGDECDFQITNITGGIIIPPLQILNINNLTTNEIHLCETTCDQHFDANLNVANCMANFVWTINGHVDLEHTRSRFTFYELEDGIYNLCVTAFIGTPDNYCNKSNTRCLKVNVKRENRIANTRVICNERLPFVWHNQWIQSSGTYIHTFIENCCIIDSTVEFIIREKIRPRQITILNCSEDRTYIDPLSKRQYSKCTANDFILLKNGSEINGCDTSYILNVAFADVKVNFKMRCRGGEVFMYPEIIDQTDSCGINPNIEFKHSWYKKQDGKFNHISNEHELKINESGNYQLELNLYYQKGESNGNCLFYFDENINEDDFLKVPNSGILLGKQEVCRGDQECYNIEDIVENPFAFNWRVEGGTIITHDPSKEKRICVEWNKDTTLQNGKVCATYSDSCSTSREACLDIQFGRSNKNIAGPDQQVRGIDTRMFASGKKGKWIQVSGPGNSRFKDDSDPKTFVRVDRFGKYTYQWSVVEDGCEIYGLVTINFFKEIPEKEGEYPGFLFDRNRISTFDFGLHYDNETLVVFYNGPDAENLTGKIFNHIGQQITFKNFIDVQTDDKLDHSISLVPGIYFYVLENDINTVAKAFVVGR